MEISFKLNSKTISTLTTASESALDLLRRLGIKSVRSGCDQEGSCGACAIMLNGKTVNSCILIAAQLDGADVLTVEGLNSARELHPIQKAFIEAGVVQCGYCTPAQILAVKELFDISPSPGRELIKDVLSGSICRCTGYQQLFEAVEILKNGASKDVGKTYREDLKLIGKDIAKTDAVQFVRGESSFTEDIIDRDALCIKILRSPHSHALIRSIDKSEAEQMEGVELIITHENAPDKLYNTAGQGFPEPSPYDRRLVDKKVRYVGDRVAIVAASDEETAKKALKKIKVDYEILEAIFDPDSASAPNAVKIHDDTDCIHQFDIGADLKVNRAASNSGGIGDVKAGFDESEFIVEHEYETERVQCTPVEPHIAYAQLLNGRMHISSPTQVPFHVRRIIASILEVKETKVHIKKEKVGGGFGSKQDMVIEDVPAWVTWTTGKPSYFRYTREEEFMARPRYKMKISVKAGADKEGRLKALEMNITAPAGAYGPHCLTVPMNACSKSLPIFKCDNMRYSVNVYYVNLPASGAYQGYGAPQGSFALQLAIAELAEKAGIDHVKFLEINAVEKGYRLEILKCLGEGKEGIAQTVSSAGIHESLKKGSEMIGWGKDIKEEPGIMKGQGVAIIQQGSGLPGIDAANAVIKQLADGNFMVLFGGTDLGTGLDTVAAKVAAEILCVDYDGIAVTAADTDVTPFDVGSYASSGTYFSGMSVYKAAENMKELLLSAASEMLTVPREALRIEYPGRVVYAEKSINFADIAHSTQSGTGSGQLIAKASFTTDKAPVPYGSHFVELSVNKNTGAIKIDKYYALLDCGTPINPKLALGQIYGGALKTIGHSLYEQMLFDSDGKCMNSDFLDYKVPMIKDLPEDFRAELVFTEDELGPFGAKSIGEVVSNGAAPAIAAAIYNATGVWMRSWPFTAEKLLSGLKKQQI